MIYKTLHLKRKTEQHKPHEKTGVSSGAPEGLAFDFDLFYLMFCLSFDLSSNCLYVTRLMYERTLLFNFIYLLPKNIVPQQIKIKLIPRLYS